MILPRKYNIATVHKGPLTQCKGPNWRLYLPKRASPIPRPMTMARMKLSWNVLRRQEGLIVCVIKRTRRLT